MNRVDSGSALTLGLLLAVHAPAAPPVTALAYRGDGTLIVAADRQVMAINTDTGRTRQWFAEAPGPVTALAVGPDGKTLAYAAGWAGRPSVIRLIAPDGASRESPGQTDAIYGLAFTGDRLASAGYDRLVELHPLAAGQSRQSLKDHSDAIYGLAVQPGGPLIATCAADRAVKIWDRETGRRLYSLTDSTDWLYAVAFSPDGKRVAAGGVDKSIRVWELSKTEGKLLAAFFAHDGAILRLAFSPDGQTLYSLADDRTLKTWDWAKQAERRPTVKLAADPLTLAMRADGQQIAIGRHDGLVSVIDAVTWKALPDITPGRAEPPAIARVEPDAVPRGRTVTLTLHGERLDKLTEVATTTPGVRLKLGDGSAAARAVEAILPAETPAGPLTLTARGPDGEARASVLIDLFNARPVADGVNPTDTTLVGRLDRPGSTHAIRFALRKGQEFGAAITLPPGGKLAGALQLTDPAGRLVAEGATSLGAIAASEGEYRLMLHDRDYRGGADFGYRLHVGAVPVLTGVFPLGLPAGSAGEIALRGVHLSAKTVRLAAGKDAMPGAKLPVTTPTAFGQADVVVGAYPETSDPKQPVPVPGTANGRLAAPGSADVWSFAARKGQTVVIEAMARAYGSPVDPVIELIDADGRPLERARLQCVAKTVTVLRDVSASAAGIRLEAWNEFATDDYCLLGREVIRIKNLPGHPDADCDFYAVDGQRLTYFDTTPGLHPLGATMYKVRVHPAGTPLPPNGYPVVPLYWRNDDGGPGYGKDARIIFPVPADGTYRVRVSDSRGWGGDLFAYRLTVRPAAPDFAVRVGSMNPTVARGQAVAVGVVADRRDGFDGPIAVRLDGLPPGLSCPPTVIEAGQTRATLLIAAAADAPDPPESAKPQLVAVARIAEADVRRTTTLGRPKLGAAGDLVTHFEQSEVRVRPGQETVIRMRIDRKNGFAGRVPVEVKGLPHGVHVLHIGLNGILITEKESARTIALYAEPWVAPGEFPIAVVAKVEGKNTEHAAPPVPLRIER